MSLLIMIITMLYKWITTFCIYKHIQMFGIISELYLYQFSVKNKRNAIIMFVFHLLRYNSAV